MSATEDRTSEHSLVVNDLHSHFDRLASVLTPDVEVPTVVHHSADHFIGVINGDGGHIPPIASHCVTKLRSATQLKMEVLRTAKHLLQVGKYESVGTRENKKAGLDTYAFSATGINLSLRQWVDRSLEREPGVAASSGVDSVDRDQCKQHYTIPRGGLTTEVTA